MLKRVHLLTLVLCEGVMRSCGHCFIILCSWGKGRGGMGVIEIPEVGWGERVLRGVLGWEKGMG